MASNHDRGPGHQTEAGTDTDTAGTTGAPFGARLPRKEDARLLTGRGRYLADVRLPDMVQLAFVRSTVAHGRIRSIDASAALEVDGVLAVAVGTDPDFADLGLVATSALPSHVETPQPALARHKVRYQGEAVAAVVATNRYVAEDGAELVDVEYEEYPAHVDPVAAYRAEGHAVHDHAPDNVLVSRIFEAGEVERALAGADLVIERTYDCNRHAGGAAGGPGSGGVVGRCRRLTDPARHVADAAHAPGCHRQRLRVGRPPGAGGGG